MSPIESATALKAQFGPLVSDPSEFRREVTLQISQAARILEVCQFAKKVLGFDFLIDISSVDHYGEDPRFAVVYELYGMNHHCHLRLRTWVDEEHAELPSVTSVWRAADWHEREIYDMMGIGFAGHPDPRRILMWEGYPHHPLRKDFPLAGRETELPDTAFTRRAPLEGGPFVTSGGPTVGEREPRSRETSGEQRRNLPLGQTSAARRSR